jgi:phosphorylase/glycogen(starch) synthase
MTLSKHGYFFEVSWEVCNMVGGIHTVLMTKATEMEKHYGDNYITVGPNVPHPISTSPVFSEEIWDESFYISMQELANMGILVRMGRWLIPGEPKCLLVSSRRLGEQRDRILAQYWERYQLNSLFGSWDYIEPVLFAHAVGLVIERIFSDHILARKVPCIVQAHEWMTGVALLHLKDQLPEIATVFTTHATILGRSLSAQTTNELLLARLRNGNPQELAQQVGVISKHSLESIVAKQCDVFTTVSKTTSDECEVVLERKPDVLLLNAIGEEVPSPALLEKSAKQSAKLKLLQIATRVTGSRYKSQETITIITSGRYEFTNKGIDLFIGAIGELQKQQGNIPESKQVIAFVMCPRDHGHINTFSGKPLLSTHEIADENHDPVIRAAQDWGLSNDANSRVHLVFVPLYLNGQDSTFPYQYYDILTGADLSCFPSWYEPWGYTPLEAIALGVPTITSDLAGFGQWAKEFGEWNDTGVKVLKRIGSSSAETQSELFNSLVNFTQLNSIEKIALSGKALKLSQQARWKNFSRFYFEAHQKALEKVQARTLAPGYDRFRSFSMGHLMMPTKYSTARAHVRNFQVKSRYSEVLEGLLRVAEQNIWWTWNPKIFRLFSLWDEKLWDDVEQNPRLFLEGVDDKMLTQLLLNTELKKLLEEVQADLLEISQRQFQPEIAYFCMEYGLVDQLRIYSGGLGILAGDHLKTAADIQMPLVAFGLFYRYGYFRQNISSDGVQESTFHRVDHLKAPLEPILDESGGAMIFNIPCREVQLYFKVWKLSLGGVNLFLIDTDVSDNSLELRLTTDRLYPNDPEKRVMQEWVLSNGGLEIIKHLKFKPSTYHMNEGHTAFLILGRAVRLMQEHSLSFEEALVFVRHTTVFTTHTPVPAGHDQFPEELISKVLVPFLKSNGFSDEMVFKAFSLGRSLDFGPNALFSMTGLAIRGSQFVNGVSRIHGEVSRKMFHSIYPELDPSEVPVTSVTNGIHLRSWIAPHWQNLFSNEMGIDWYKHVRSENYWDKFHYLPNEKIWKTKIKLKKQLVNWISTYIRANLLHEQRSRPELSAILGSLNENTLIITHAKRMTPYKRADLLFSNKERLQKILNGDQPILLIYAGKSHPADGAGQALIQKINHFAKQPEFLGKILFIENYDLEFAQKLIAGSDLWINTPLRPLEACGTSGMKAGVNGTLNFAVADGWWPEFYNGKNGWMIGSEKDVYRDELQNGMDVNAIFHMLETEIIPLYQERSEEGVPEKWVEKIKESIGSLIPHVTSERMLADYNETLYQPATNYFKEFSSNEFNALKKLIECKNILVENWDSVSFLDVTVSNPSGDSWMVDDNIEVHVSLKHKGLPIEMLEVQAITESTSGGCTHAQKTRINMFRPEVRDGKCEDGESSWVAMINLEDTGAHSMSLRLQPKRFKTFRPINMTVNLTKWL